MDFKEKVKKFLALSSTVLLTTLSEGVKAEEYSLDKSLTQIAFGKEITKQDIKSIRDIIEERLDGAKNWVENSKELERLFGDNIPSFPLELMVKKDKDKETRYFLYKNKEGEKGFIVYTEGNGYFIPFGKTDIKDLNGNPVKPYMSDMVLLGQLSLSAKEFRDALKEGEKITEEINKLTSSISILGQGIFATKGSNNTSDMKFLEFLEQKEGKTFNLDSFMFLNRDKLNGLMLDEVGRGFGILNNEIDIEKREIIAKEVNLSIGDFKDIPDRIKPDEFDKIGKEVIEILNKKTGLNTEITVLNSNNLGLGYKFMGMSIKDKIVLLTDGKTDVDKNTFLSVVLHEYGHVLHQKELVASALLYGLSVASKNTGDKELSEKLDVYTSLAKKNAERTADMFAISILGKERFTDGLKKVIDLLPDLERLNVNYLKETGKSYLHPYPSEEERIEIKEKLNMRL